MALIGVLIVEDDEPTRNLLVECLQQRAGLDVDVARDGAEALHQISTHDYKVVVLDVVMPNMSGIDLLHSLSALDGDPSLKSLREPPAVLVITGAAPDTVRANDLEARFPRYVRGVLHKPLDADAFTRAVESLSAR
jgi:CheY-like chemotaxis protein